MTTISIAIIILVIIDIYILVIIDIYLLKQIDKHEIAIVELLKKNGMIEEVHDD